MISGVFPYARARLKILGFKEWEGGFAFENIPNQRLDSVFHLTLGRAVTQGNNQDNQKIRVPFIVRLFKAPSADTRKLIDQGIQIADDVISDFLAAENRTTQDEIKDIEFDSMSVDPLSSSDDSGVIIELNFRAYVIMSTR